MEDFLVGRESRGEGLEVLEFVLEGLSGVLEGGVLGVKGWEDGCVLVDRGLQLVG